MSLDPADLFAAFLVGLVGTALIVWGRRQTRVPHMAAGALLIVLTIIVPGWPLLLSASIGIGVLLVIAVRNGL